MMLALLAPLAVFVGVAVLASFPEVALAGLGAVAAALVIRRAVRWVNRRDDPRQARLPE